eukprot:scaffold254388_cov17-Tisochrysis_lutea.AAC.1
MYHRGAIASNAPQQMCTVRDRMARTIWQAIHSICRSCSMHTEVKLWECEAASTGNQIKSTYLNSCIKNLWYKSLFVCRTPEGAGSKFESVAEAAQSSRFIPKPSKEGA